MQRDRFALALLAYGLLNATLYTGLLPLWEGFDEPFHYGYVQHIRERREFPRMGETTLSSEVWASIQLAPVSHIVQRNISGTITFGEYFRMTPAERSRLRDRLYAIDPGLAASRSDAQNYEAHQAPLAYVLLAPFDALWRGLPLPDRVRRLRLVCGWVATALMLAGSLALARSLGLPAEWRAVAGFLALTLQMFYASTAHVCNDWLAVPLFTWLLVAATRARSALPAAFSAGLLAKAYFLAAAPLAVFAGARSWRSLRIWALAPLLVAAAWYGRNLALYGSVSGMQEARGGIPAASLVEAARRVPWRATVATSAHAALWAGNNSDISFHRRTVDLMLCLLAAGLVLFVARRKRRAGEGIVAAAVALHLAALGFATVQSFWYTSGLQVAPSPWFIQPVYVAVVCLAVCGLAPAGRAGKGIGVAAIWTWAYVLCATYWLKLIPLYAGYPSSQAQPARLWRWYTHEFPAALDSTALMSSTWILVLAALVAAMTIGIAGWLTARVIGSRSLSAS